MTTPCRELLTDGALKCPWDHGRKPPKWIGWQPLIRESGQPVCVVVQGYSAMQIAELENGQEVIVKRDKGRNKPVAIVKATSKRLFKGIETKLASPVLFERWLLTLWSDAILAAHFGVRGIPHKRGDGPSDNPVSLPQEQEQPVQRTVRADDPRTIGDVLNGVLKRKH